MFYLVQNWLVLIAVSLPIHSAASGDLFDKVASTLESRYYDREFAEDELPGLIEQYRERAANTVEGEPERELVFEFLSHVPASHLGLLSKSAHQSLMAELFGEPGPTIGFELAEQDGTYFVRTLFEGGPAEEAGILTGDVVISINGDAPADSPRLEWRTDDAALPDLPRHRVLARGEGEQIELVVESKPGEQRSVTVTAASYPALRAARASAEVFRHAGAEIGYVHFWYMHNHTLDTMLAELVNGPFADADALILDLRGRGGSAHMVARLASQFAGGIWAKPLVVLIDSETRSGKEVLSYELQQQGIGRFVGQKTAGAVLPATFQPVGDDMVLMFPQFIFGPYTEAIEGKGVAPHVEADEPGAYAAGSDPIFNAGLDEAARLVATSLAPVNRQRDR